MFSLCFGFWDYVFKKEEVHILILGLDKAGKTTLLEKLKSYFADYLGLEPEQILPTVGLNVGRMEAYNTQLIFWDLGGQSGLRSIWDKYYGESHAILYVVDAADAGRFQESKDALQKVRPARAGYHCSCAAVRGGRAAMPHTAARTGHHRQPQPTNRNRRRRHPQVLASKDLDGAPLLVAANKQDAEGCVAPPDVSKALGLSIMSNRPHKVQPISAYTGEGVRDGIHWLVEQIRRCPRSAALRKRAVKL